MRMLIDAVAKLQDKLTRLWLFSLNCTIFLSQPMGVPQLRSHVSSACALTCDCTKMLALSGSMPQAMYVAAELLVACKSAFGSCGRVIACRSTTQKNVSAATELLMCDPVHVQPDQCMDVMTSMYDINNRTIDRTVLHRSKACSLTIQVLQFDPVANGSKVVAQMQCACRLDP